MGQGRTALDKRYDTTTARKRTDLVFLFFSFAFTSSSSPSLFFFSLFCAEEDVERDIYLMCF
jgi:hypothetical protein